MKAYTCTTELKFVKIRSFLFSHIRNTIIKQFIKSCHLTVCSNCVAMQAGFTLCCLHLQEEQLMRRNKNCVPAVTVETI